MTTVAQEKTVHASDSLQHAWCTASPSSWFKQTARPSYPLLWTSQVSCTDKLTEVKAETVQQHLPHLSPQLAQIPPQLLDPLLQTQVCMANLQMQKSDPCAICTYVCIHTNKSRTKHSWYTSHTSQCGFQSITITWQLVAEVLLYAACKSKQRSVLWCLTAHT